MVARATGRKQHFSVDGDGDWVNAQEAATFVSPNILVHQYANKSREICDLWCHQYMPREGDNIVDIGAGIGDEAVIFSHIVGTRGRIIAIEAHPLTFSCLEKSLNNSGITNVAYRQIAISDKLGQLHISNDENHIGNSVTLDGDGIMVPAITIDELIKEEGLEHISLLKINIEGAERLALEGMTATRDITDYLAVSCHDFLADRFGASADALRTREEICDLLSGWGWEIARRKDDPRHWVRDFVYAKNLNRINVRS